MAVLFLITSCGKHFYQDPNFTNNTIGHRRIAILPAKVTFTGKIPNKMTDAQYQDLLVAESKIAQEGLANSLMMNNSKKQPLTVSIQNVTETNRLLTQNNINWENASSVELCKILGVDAVVKQELQKERFMSDYASYGISILSDVLNQLPVSILGVPTNSLPTSSSTYKLIDNIVITSKNSEDILWKSNFVQEANWNYPPEQIQKDIYRKVVSNFPYKYNK